MKKYLLVILLIFTSFAFKTYAQTPVEWSIKLVDVGNNYVELTAMASIDQGWHLYDTKIPDGGPYPTSLSVEKMTGAILIGQFKATDAKLYKEFDKVFEMVIGYYKDNVTFVQRIKITDKDKFSLAGDIRAQACNDRDCTPPIPVDFSFTNKNLPAGITNETATAVSETPIEKEILPNDSLSTDNQSNSEVLLTGNNTSDSSLWTPVIEQIKKYGAAGDVSSKSLWTILLYGILGGLIALMTPCVWPIIPMTVSFFLKRNKKNKGKAIREAITYGIAIVVIYVILGLLITAIFGASALNEMSTSALFNLIFFAVLLFFAASFLGAFELVLPSSWTNKIDAKADSTTGILSIFFMAFTLALVSFSCTGPIIGTLLVETASTGAIVGPAIGMFGFALGLAIPFSLFAIFPSWLEGMPKSGGWLNSVKVVLGFLELALALKFLSVADMAYGWRILDREVFLVLWIVIFALLGMYLLGKLRFAHDSEVKSISVTRLFLAIISFAFAVYLVPGLWGAPLKSVSAFTPTMQTQDFSLYEGDVHAKFDDYEAGMEYARKNNKPVMIDFSGYGCVNCRKMEASVWSDPRVKHILENDYVLITLMVDDRKKLPEVIEVEENGKTTKLKTIGDKWSYLQRHKFGTNSQPYYVLLNDEGIPIGPSYAYDENVDKYLKFLNTGLENFSKENK